MYSKTNSAKLGKFLTAETKNIEILFYLYPHALKFFASFLEAVGTSRQIFIVGNIGHGHYFVIGTWLQSVKVLATL